MYFVSAVIYSKYLSLIPPSLFSYGVNTCPVCLEGLAGKDPVKMPCSHVICLVCISQWIAQERSCPLCKQEVPEAFRVMSTKAVRYDS